MRKLLNGVGGLLLVALGVFYFSSGTKKPAEPAVTVPIAATAPPAPDETPKEILVVSADELVSVYHANEVAGDNQFKGKPIAIFGTLKRIAKDIGDDTYLMIGTNEFRAVHCTLAEGQNTKAATLKKGTRMIVGGKVTGMIMGDVLVAGCGILEASPADIKGLADMKNGDRRCPANGVCLVRAKPAVENDE